MYRVMQCLICLYSQSGKIAFKQKLGVKFFFRTLFDTKIFDLCSDISDVGNWERWYLSALAFIWFSLNQWNRILVLDSNFFTTLSKLNFLYKEYCHQLLVRSLNISFFERIFYHFSILPINVSRLFLKERKSLFHRFP